MKYYKVFARITDMFGKHGVAMKVFFAQSETSAKNKALRYFGKGSAVLSVEEELED